MSENMSAPDRMQHAMMCYYAVLQQGMSPKEAYCAVCIAERLSIIEMDELWEKLKDQATATAECEKVTAAEMLDAMKDHVKKDDKGEQDTGITNDMIQQIIDKVKNPKKVKVKLTVAGSDDTSIKVISGYKIDDRDWLSKVDEIDNPGGDTDEA